MSKWRWIKWLLVKFVWRYLCRFVTKWLDFYNSLHKCMHKISNSICNVKMYSIWKQIIFFLPNRYYFANRFLVRTATFCSLLLLSPAFLPGLNLCRPCTCNHSLCDLTCASIMLCLDDAVSMGSSIPWTYLLNGTE